MSLRMVVLPAPLRPTSADDFAVVHREIEMVEDPAYRRDG